MSNYLHVLSIGIIVGLAFGFCIRTTPLYAQEMSGSAGIVVEEAAQTSIAQALLERAQTSWPWYVTRASGIMAALVMVILILSGIGFITGTTYAFLEPITAWATHRALGITLALSILLHMGALYFDRFVPFGISDILIPFASDYRPVQLFGISFGSLYVALGVLAFYLVLLIVLVSLTLIEKKPKTWKTTHYLTYLAVAFVFFHALYIGTDLAHGLLRWVWMALGGVVLVAALFRLWRVKTL